MLFPTEKFSLGKVLMHPTVLSPKAAVPLCTMVAIHSYLFSLNTKILPKFDYFLNINNKTNQMLKNLTRHSDTRFEP